MLARTLLVASRAFGERLSAERVATAVARGLQDGGWQTDRCPIEDGCGPATVRAQLDALGFDVRMRAAGGRGGGGGARRAR
jgi:glycerate kinase